MNEDDKFDTITVELTKRSGKGLGKATSASLDSRIVLLSFLGFSIIGRRNGCGVFISHIVIELEQLGFIPLSFLRELRSKEVRQRKTVVSSPGI